MRPLITFSLYVIFLYFTNFCAAAPGTQIQTVVLTTGEWAPYITKQSSDYGIATNCIALAFKKQNISCDFKFMPWQRALLFANQGEYVGTFVWSEQESRHDNFWYSDPVFFDTKVLFHLKHLNGKLDDLNALEGFKVGIASDSTFKLLNSLESQGKIKLVNNNNPVDNFNLLLQQDLNVVSDNLLIGLAKLKSLPASDRLLISYTTPEYLPPQSYHVLFSKKHPESRLILEKFNLGLAKLKKSGQYKNLWNKTSLQQSIQKSS